MLLGPGGDKAAVGKIVESRLARTTREARLTSRASVSRVNISCLVIRWPGAKRCRPYPPKWTDALPRRDTRYTRCRPRPRNYRSGIRLENFKGAKEHRRKFRTGNGRVGGEQGRRFALCDAARGDKGHRVLKPGAAGTSEKATLLLATA
jgi:hypothetical protein